MGLADQALRQRQIIQQPQRLVQGGAVIQHLADIGLLRRALIGLVAAGFVFQHLAQGGLRAFDPARQHRFLRGQRRQQNIRVGDAMQYPVIPGHGGIGRTDQGDQFGPAQIGGGKAALMIQNRHATSPINSRAAPTRSSPDMSLGSRLSRRVARVWF